MSLHYNNYEEYEEAVSRGAERDEDYERYSELKLDIDPDWDPKEDPCQPQD